MRFFLAVGASEMGAGLLLLKGRGGQFGATSLLLFLFWLAQGGVTSSICLDALGLEPMAVPSRGLQGSGSIMCCIARLLVGLRCQI